MFSLVRWVSELTSKLILLRLMVRKAGMYSRTLPTYDIPWITEHELMELKRRNGEETGTPKFACMTKQGHVLFYPHFEISNVRLMCQSGGKK